MARKGENIYKRKDGRWEGRYIKDRDISGKAIYGYVYAKSYGEVRKKLVDAKMNTSKQSSTKESLSTFSDWIDLWMEQKRVSVKQSKSNIIHKVINIAVKYLLTFLDGPYLYTIIIKPTKDKRCFIIPSA